VRKPAVGTVEGEAQNASAHVAAIGRRTERTSLDDGNPPTDALFDDGLIGAAIVRTSMAVESLELLETPPALPTEEMQIQKKRSVRLVSACRWIGPVEDGRASTREHMGARQGEEQPGSSSQASSDNACQAEACSASTQRFDRAGRRERDPNAEPFLQVMEGSSIHLAVGCLDDRDPREEPALVERTVEAQTHERGGPQPVLAPHGDHGVHDPLSEKQGI
jgi:hypothetical protein